MASITSIPLELLVIISYDLSTQDLGALRCTCKQIEKSLFDYFTQEFFSKRQFMFTQPSLQTLVDISNHGVLSKQLKHVIISTDQYHDAHRDFRDSDAAEKFMQGLADQKALLDHGLARELLTEAFLKLPNVETVGVRDYNARGRIRDNDAQWTSYGAPTVYAETGYSLTTNDPHYYYQAAQNVGEGGFASRVFATTYYAVAKARRSPPEFEVILRQRNGGLCDNAFVIPEFTLPVIEPVLQGTKSLLLTLSLRNSNQPLLIGGERVTCHGRHLRKFLSHTPNLTHLRLNFQKQQTTENDEFLQWLGEAIPTGPYSYAPYLPAPVALPCLSRIDIGMLTTTHHILLAPLVKFAPSLKGISIWRVTLNRPIYHGNMGDQTSNYWIRLFDTLAKLPNFEPDYLLFGALTQEFYQVRFKVSVPDEDDETLPNADGDDEEKKVETTNKVEFSGRKDMDEFLKSLVRRVDVQFPKPQVFQNQEAEEDEDEDMDDDDGDDEEDEEEEEEE